MLLSRKTQKKCLPLIVIDIIQPQGKPRYKVYFIIIYSIIQIVRARGQTGLLKMSWSFLVLAITLTGYRRGEKWAWYTLWLVPVLLVSSALFNVSVVGDVFQTLEWIPVMTASLLGLLLPYRKFFPR
jgi:hypothetical protein